MNKLIILFLALVWVSGITVATAYHIHTNTGKSFGWLIYGIILMSLYLGSLFTWAWNKSKQE